MDNTWTGIIILFTILGATGTAYRWLHQDISGLRERISTLELEMKERISAFELEMKERMAKIEGAFGGFMNRGNS
ncbi:MAG: hypothetical protein OXL41_12455 [Nitrospinae bacterium]|nr:hypothetical protein [Nitrospinota bacterium]